MTKAEGVIGLARRAGQIAVGTNGTLDAIRSGKAKLVLIASDVSENTRKLLTDKALFRNVPTEFPPLNTEALGKCVGKFNTAAVAFLQDGFVIAYHGALSVNQEGEL
ncbi:MAG: ribosomal L7Ae/L30e/S12e/Gadd45 family protein [Clostridiales bacterium]|nr:ribosomal L7Ae/L30e/S12e/Gadd45 family protein [Candidatus Coliplasma caballi]